MSVIGPSHMLFDDECSDNITHEEIMNKSISQMAKQMADEIDVEILNAVHKRASETEEETVIRLLKGDFEEETGISFERFMEIYNDIMQRTPEKLI